MKKYEIILEYLEELIKEPKCELNYFNDYSLLIAIILSAQTKDSRVNEVTKILFDKYKSLKEIKEANIEDLIEIIKPLGIIKKAYYVKELATILVDKYQSKVPDNYNELLKLPGVGKKTISVFLSEYYNQEYIAVDTHVLRVSNRLGLVKSNNPEKVEKELEKHIKKNRRLFHLRMVLFGRYYCTSKNPKCSNCKLKGVCKYERI